MIVSKIELLRVMTSDFDIIPVWLIRERNNLESYEINEASPSMEAWGLLFFKRKSPSAKASILASFIPHQQLRSFGRGNSEERIKGRFWCIILL
jgi:hypothetical protein